MIPVIAIGVATAMILTGCGTEKTEEQKFTEVFLEVRDSEIQNLEEMVDTLEMSSFLASSESSGSAAVNTLNELDKKYQEILNEYEGDIPQDVLQYINLRREEIEYRRLGLFTVNEDKRKEHRLHSLELKRQADDLEEKLVEKFVGTE